MANTLKNEWKPLHYNDYWDLTTQEQARYEVRMPPHEGTIKLHFVIAWIKVIQVRSLVDTSTVFQVRKIDE